MFAVAVERGLQGFVAKRRAERYRPGERSWVIVIVRSVQVDLSTRGAGLDFASCVFEDRLVLVDVTREGGCACGAVRYRLTSDPLFTNCCHCLNCQRQTGSAFVINLLIEADRVQLLAGEPQPVEVPRDDGTTQRIFRCPTCQVAVFSEYSRPVVRFVRAGTLDEPSSVQPDAHIFTRSKLSWVAIPDSVPAFEVYYDMNTLWPTASLERRDAILTRKSTGD